MNSSFNERFLPLSSPSNFVFNSGEAFHISKTSIRLILPYFIVCFFSRPFFYFALFLFSIKTSHLSFFPFFVFFFCPKNVRGVGKQECRRCKVLQQMRELHEYDWTQAIECGGRLRFELIGLVFYIIKCASLPSSLTIEVALKKYHARRHFALVKCATMNDINGFCKMLFNRRNELNKWNVSQVDSLRCCHVGWLSSCHGLLRRGPYFVIMRRFSFVIRKITVLVCWPFKKKILT